jgi:hypothetical protein
LAQEIVAEPVCGVGDGRRGALQVSGAEQPDHAVAQVLALKQDEHHEQEHDAGGGGRELLTCGRRLAPG